MSGPVIPARIEFGDGPPRATDYSNVYHPAAGALDQARHVFIAGNHLPHRWRGRGAFTIVETGFGLCHNVLATLEAWHADPQRCTRLHIVSIEKHPLLRADLERALAPLVDNKNATDQNITDTLRRNVQDLLAQWPPLTTGMHRLRFAEGAITLDLVFADVHDALREVVCSADAFFLDGFAPAHNPTMWDARVFRAVSRLAAHDATAATWSVARLVRDGLKLAGFDVHTAPGFGGKRDMLVAHRRPLPEGRRRYDTLARLGPATPIDNDSDHNTAVIIGAGLAGAHVAAALAARGMRCTVLDRHAQPAQEASGGVAGIFHGTVHVSDNLHARLYRCASLEAARSYRKLLNQSSQSHEMQDDARHAIPGAIEGLLRPSDATLDDMRARVAHHALPPDWVQVLDAKQASQRAGVTQTQPCWFFPHAGWIAPQALVRHLLQPNKNIRFVGNANVARLVRINNTWHAHAPDGSPLAHARICVLASAQHATALAPWAHWPLHTGRGQSTVVPAGTPDLAVPHVPISSRAYAITLGDGSVLCGASAHRNDPEAATRDEDTRDNLDKLERLTGSRPVVDPCTLESRVAWRCHATDRMPIVGAVPARNFTPTVSHVHTRHIAREPGLYVLTALGSRGLTLAPLMAEAVAASIMREPMPMEASLLDAVDAARFVFVGVRQVAAGQ